MQKERQRPGRFLVNGKWVRAKSDVHRVLKSRAGKYLAARCESLGVSFRKVRSPITGWPIQVVDERALIAAMPKDPRRNGHYLTQADVLREFEIARPRLLTLERHKKIQPIYQGRRKLYARKQLKELRRNGGLDVPRDGIYAQKSGDVLMSLKTAAARYRLSLDRLNAAVFKGRLRSDLRTPPASVRDEHVVWDSDVRRYLNLTPRKTGWKPFDGSYSDGDGNRWLNVSAVAKLFKVSRATVLDVIHRSVLPAEKRLRPGTRRIYEHTVIESDACNFFRRWTPPAGYVKETELATRLSVMGFERRLDLRLALKEGRDAERIRSEKCPHSRAIYYHADDVARFLVEYQTAITKKAAAPSVKRGRGRPSDWIECYQYVIQRRSDPANRPTIRAAMEEFKSKNPAKRIIVNKSAINRASVYIHRLHEQGPGSGK
jgi:hypothetical protein